MTEVRGWALIIVGCVALFAAYVRAVSRWTERWWQEAGD